jgi:hypothetical protein
MATDGSSAAAANAATAPIRSSLRNMYIYIVAGISNKRVEYSQVFFELNTSKKRDNVESTFKKDEAKVTPSGA